MKSRFFTDTRALDASPPPCDKVCVCLLMRKQAYEKAVQNASRMHITTGEYMDRLILRSPFSGGGTTALQPSDNPQPCFPPAPPDH